MILDIDGTQYVLMPRALVGRQIDAEGTPGDLGIHQVGSGASQPSNRSTLVSERSD